MSWYYCGIVLFELEQTALWRVFSVFTITYHYTGWLQTKPDGLFSVTKACIFHLLWIQSEALHLRNLASYCNSSPHNLCSRLLQICPIRSTFIDAITRGDPRIFWWEAMKFWPVGIRHRSVSVLRNWIASRCTLHSIKYILLHFIDISHMTIIIINTQFHELLTCKMSSHKIHFYIYWGEIIYHACYRTVRALMYVGLHHG